MSTSSPSGKRRIIFIDALRAYAILMMLQGHFTDIMLAPEFRDPDHPIFAGWLFMRGMTAPIFFFTTGLVFVYLLLRNEVPLLENKRVIKGVRRGFFLILVGYLLRLNFPALISFKIFPSFYAVDVLHCIGLSLIGLVAVYALHQLSRLSFPALLASLGAILFLIYPDIKAADWSGLPAVLSNYLSKANGSVFTPIPWMGYAFIGGVMGYYVKRHSRLDLSNWLPAALIVSGLLIHYYSSNWLLSFYHLSGWENFRASAYNNFLFWQLGHVFIVIAIVILICRFWNNIPALFLKTGQETLTIYSLHYVVLYGTWFGVGIAQLWKYSLSPWATLLGASIFLLTFVVMIAYIEQLRHILYKKIPAQLYLFYRFAIFKGRLFIRLARVKLVRFYFRLKYPKATVEAIPE